MKKQVLLSGMVFISGVAMAQQAVIKPQSVNTPAVYNKILMKGNEVLSSILAPANPYVSDKNTDFATGYQIGNTYYDMQTNSSMGHRIVNFSDGSVSATWTFGTTPPGYSERGTGYNYMDAAENWGSMPTARQEASVRTGWPDLAALGNGELVISHEGTAVAHQLSRAAKGGSTWDTDAAAAPSGLWPRVAVSGNTVHLITCGDPDANPAQGLSSPLYYHKSTDGGATWAMTDVILPGLDSSLNHGYGGDSYALDANGNNVAILVVGDYNSTFLMKSTDAGATWNRTDIIDVGLGKYDPTATGSISDINSDMVADTITNSDGSGAVLIDDNGVVHAFFGLMRYLDANPTGDTTSYFPGTNGLVYWRDDNPTQLDTITGALDVDGSGVLMDNYEQGSIAEYYVSLSSWPTAGIDASGALYLTYSAVVETLTDNPGGSPFQYYRQIYIMKSSDGGLTWDEPYHIPTQFQFGEYAYPAMNRNVENGVLHIVCQKDGSPGISVSGDTDPVGDNEITYFQIPASLPGDLGMESAAAAGSFAIYPNPALSHATLNINATQAAEATLQVIDITGKTVMMRNQNLNAGMNQVNLDVQNLSTGIYSVNVRMGKEMFTQKLIKK